MSVASCLARVVVAMAVTVSSASVIVAAITLRDRSQLAPENIAGENGNGLCHVVTLLASCATIEELCMEDSVSSSVKWAQHHLLHVTYSQGWCESSEMTGL